MNYAWRCSMPESIISVAIIEDQPDVREGLALLIGETAGYRCLHKFASMEEAIENIGSDLPDVVLCDIGLPGMSGIEGVRIIKEAYPGLQILMLTIYDDDERIFQAMCAGACGYLLKKTAPAKLLESLRDVVAGGAPMSPEVARRVVALFRTIRPKEASACQLTPQESRLLKLLGEGHHYKTAAAELGLSVNTISFHLRGIYGKLQVHSKSEAVAKALREGLIQ
jgi:DNA-binding NarL/FixJ family response regulator